MASLNKAMLIGNLGRDPEVRYTQDGKAIASFSIATTLKWRDKATGENREKTEWHRIKAFNRLGEICGEYLAKGRQVYIEGRLQTSSWEKDGVTRYTTEVIAETMQMLGSKDSGGGYGGNNQGGGFQGASGSGQGGGFQGANGPSQGGQSNGPDNAFSGGPPPQPPDDDIPF